MEIKDKTIRKFKDENNNVYKIMQKNNNHYYLTIKKDNDDFATTISENKYEIFCILKELHKKTKFIEF